MSDNEYEEDRVYATFAQKLILLMATIEEAKMLRQQLIMLMQRLAPKLQTEIIGVLAETQERIQEIDKLTHRLTTVQSSLKTDGYYDIDAIGESYINAFETKKWPTCKLGTDTSCGQCRFRIFVSREALWEHLARK